MNKRKQQAIETKQRLLDAADALVKEKGFDDMSVDDIVTACGVAKGTFYHYFESKADLLVYLTRAPYDELKRKFAATEGKPYLERLRAFMREWFRMVEKYNLHFTVLQNRITLLQGIPQTRSQSQIDQGRAMLLHCLKGAVQSGELRADTPVETVSLALIFSMQGSAVYQTQNPESFDVAAWSADFIPLVFDSILSPYLTQT
mgnify:CR=1 FL=1